jgi:hypothetical protein
VEHTAVVLNIHTAMLAQDVVVCYACVLVITSVNNIYFDVLLF